jgi:hypothetical protein
MRVTVNEGLGEIKEWKNITLWIKPFNSSIEIPHIFPVLEFTRSVIPILDTSEGFDKFIIRIERPLSIPDFINNGMLETNLTNSIRVNKSEYNAIFDFLRKRVQAEEHMIEDEFHPKIPRRSVTNAIMELEI